MTNRQEYKVILFYYRQASNFIPDVEDLPDEFIPRETLLLVTPFEEGLCDQFVGKTFNKGMFSVTSCSFLHKSGKEVDGVVLGEYELMVSHQRELPAVDKADYIFYINKINGPESGCTYEGNWEKYGYPEEEGLNELPEVSET
ncbi:hypothetical protein CRM22_005007 [Opisthorchis felineus]|uniref:Uncharacterized protein n=1 Tax=Opisthorchis felineus TaxID=147828 RepID=A0A4S2LTB6_OPIFE|nr:hypothetical protein CRM22_005007 [Opisthorchis felineus]